MRLPVIGVWSQLVILKAFLLLLAPTLGVAQVVQGTVIERSDNTAVPGVLVTLVDPAGRVVARTLTDQRGRYRLSASPGTYRVQTLRIGYKPVLSAELRLNAEEIEQTIAVTNIPVALEAVQVSAQRSCGSLSDANVASVWEQARAAMTVSALSAGAGTLHATLRRYERTTDASFRRTLNEWSRVDSRWVESPWRSLSADSLRRFGYVHQGDNTVTYHAPDLAVLTSSEFIEDHCFRLVASTKSDSLIGVSFEPTRERSRIADIRGDFWLDRRSSELRAMHFRYANVRGRGADDAGGELSFVRFADGTWTISNWHIRMPLMEQRITNDRVPGQRARTELSVAGWRVSGAELLSVRRDRDTLWANTALTATVTTTATATVTPTATTTVTPMVTTTVTPTVTTTVTPTVTATVTSTEAAPLSAESRASARSEFDTRRRSGGGQFLGRAEIEKLGVRSLAEVVGRLSEVRLERQGGVVWVMSTRTNMAGVTRRSSTGSIETGTRNCYVSLWLNGVQLYSGRRDEPAFDLSSVDVSTIEGIEYYSGPGTTPAKYQRQDHACGTLLIWSQ